MKVGRYELVRPIGAGGQGRVWEAVLREPAGTARSVALKLVERGSEVVREARLGGLLRHVHLVDVYEVGEHDGTWFFAMELCRGGSLADRLPLPPRAVVDVGLAVCAALAYAHAELGLVHLDLKPANLLLDGAVVKVADLGTASTEPGVQRRRSGTPGYMAPEVWSAGAVDRRADVWSLGVVLFELATGRHPTRPATRTDTLSFEIDEPTWDGPPPSEDEAPTWLAPVLDRCLAHHPWDRYQSMEELASALRALDAPGPSLAEFLGDGAAPIQGPGAEDVDPRLVGREPLLDALAALPGGLVTLRGPGGIGKSRVAREAAERHRRRTGEAVWFCALSTARSSLDLVAAIATALRLNLDRGEEPALLAGLSYALGARGDGWLVLDGFEHLVAHRAVVELLRERAPSVRILVTSRQALGAVGEQVVEVEALTPEGAAALLVAAAARRGVELDPVDPRVSELARRLEGVPLALELAAGRLGVLGLNEVLSRLSLAFLRSSTAGTSDRSATLEGALAWSWELLDEAERQTLAQLSVFRGGWTPELARQVVVAPPGTGPEDLSSVTARLADRSLLYRAGGRQRMLEVVREFAAAHLDETTGAEIRHGRALAALADELRRVGPRRAESLRKALVHELDDLVAAARRALARSDGEVAAATALGAWAVYESRGPYAPAVALLEAASTIALPSLASLVRRTLARAMLSSGHWERVEPLVEAELEGSDGDPERHAQALFLLGLLRREQGRGAEALGHVDAALAAVRALGDRENEGSLLSYLGTLHREGGRPMEAIRHLEAALLVHREVGARRAEGIALANLGNALLELRRSTEARGALQAARDLHRETGNRRSEGVVLASLARLAEAAGDPDEARRCLEASLALHRDVGNRNFEGVTLGMLGTQHHRLGRLGEARRDLEGALAIHREVGNRRFEGVVLGVLAHVEVQEGRPVEARRHLEEALVIHRAVGNPRSEGVALADLGRMSRDEGRTEEALALLGEALALHREAGDRPFEADALRELGDLHAQRDELPRARELLEAAVVVARTDGDRATLGSALASLGDLERRMGHPDLARSLLLEAARDLRATRERDALAATACSLALLELEERGPAAAAAPLAEARALATELGAGPTSWLGRRIAEVVARVEG